MGNTPAPVDPSQVEAQPVAPAPAPGPNHSAMASILHGALSAVRAAAGPSVPQYSVDPNTGAETQTGGGPRHGLGPILGGLLTGALTGLAGGVNAAAQAPVGGKQAASLAGGFEAAQDERQQQEQRARAQAQQKFGMEQEAQRTQLEQQKLQQEKISEEDREKSEVAKNNLLRMEIAQHQDAADKETNLKLFENDLKVREAYEKAGYETTPADAIEGNGQPGGTAKMMEYITAHPESIKAQPDGSIPVWMHDKNNGTDYIYYRSKLPVNKPEGITPELFNSIVAPGQRIKSDSPLIGPDGLIHIQPELISAIARENGENNRADIHEAAEDRRSSARLAQEKELAGTKQDQAKSKEIDDITKTIGNLRAKQMSEEDKNFLTRMNITVPSGKAGTDAAIAALQQRLNRLQGAGNAPAAPRTATDAKGNKVQWNGNAWVPVLQPR